MGFLRKATSALAVLALGVASPVAAQDVGLPVGSAGPAVSVQALDGEVVDLGRWVGRKPVVMEFWATWCPVCQALQPEMDAALARFGDRVEFLIMAVGVNQNPRTIRRHLERHPVSGRVLWDATGRATRAYQAPATAYVVILDAAGRVRYTGIGEDQELVAALEDLLDG